MSSPSYYRELLKPSPHCACFSSKMLFSSLLLALFLLSSISGDSFCFQFASRLLKVTFISPLKFQERVSPDFEMLHECGVSYAFAVLNPHHETRFSSHVAPFERRISLGSAIDELPSSRPSVTEVPFSKSAFQFRTDSTMQITIIVHRFYVLLMSRFREERL